jgi:hypothetical protein
MRNLTHWWVESCLCFHGVVDHCSFGCFLLFRSENLLEYGNGGVQQHSLCTWKVTRLEGSRTRCIDRDAYPATCLRLSQFYARRCLADVCQGFGRLRRVRFRYQQRLSTSVYDKLSYKSNKCATLKCDDG